MLSCIKSGPFPCHSSHQGNELLDLLHAGGPAGGDAHDGVGVVVFFPEAELGLAFQRGQLAVCQDGEHLVRGRIHIEAVALGGKALLQPVGGVDGVLADAGVEVVGEQHIELQAHQAAFGKQSALLLDHSHEVGRGTLGEHHGFAAQGTHLGAADVEHVGELCDVGQGHVGALGHQAVAQPRAVHEQGHVVGVADGGKRFQLCPGVQGAVLRGVGDVDWGKYVSALTDIGFEGYTCIEIEDKSFEGSEERVLDSLKLSLRYMRQFVI